LREPQEPTVDLAGRKIKAMRKAILVAIGLCLLSVSDDAQMCSKVVTFALADASGVHPSMGSRGWIGNWVRKNANKHPDICFSQRPMRGRANYLIVLSQSASYFHGFEPVVRTDETWNYTDAGTATTTTTTTTRENVPYTINSNTIYANAYDDRGALVSHRSHIYSKKSGGDPADSAEYNLENELRAINARGRLIHSVVMDIEGPKGLL
jgi:hypothetical protein